MATPDMRHVASGEFEHVYEPYEDTHLLMDALVDENLQAAWFA